MKQNVYLAQTHNADWRGYYSPNPVEEFGYFVLTKYMEYFMQSSLFQTSSRSKALR